MEIINLKEKDLDIIREISKQVWPDTYKDIISKDQINYMFEKMYSIESLREQMLRLNHKYLLVKEKNEYLGFISYEINHDLETTKIHKLYVLQEAHGKGIGKILIKEVENIAKKHHNKKLILNVNRNNKAFFFYQHIGFRIEHEEDIDLGNGYLAEDYIMEKKL